MDVGVALRKKYGGRLCIYWNNLIFVPVYFKIDGTKIVVFLCNRFPFDGRSSLRGETFGTSNRSIIHSDILFNLLCFITVCGIAALPRITFFLTSSNVRAWLLFLPYFDCVISLLLSRSWFNKTKQLVKALVHDFLQTLLIILVVVRVIIYTVYHYIYGLFSNASYLSSTFSGLK